MISDETSDEDLMRKLQEGDASSLIHLYGRHANRVWIYLKKRVPPDRVEDLFQDTFIKIVEKKAQWNNQPFVLWLYVILRNTMVDYYRDEKIERRMIERLTPDFDELLPQKFEDIVGHLSPDASKLLEEYFKEGLSYKELSERYNSSEVTLRKRLSRAISILKKGHSHDR